MKRILWRVAPGAVRSSIGSIKQEFSIGIYLGASPFSLAVAERVPNPVLTRNHVTDVPASFVADPFMSRVDGRWYMFFEVMNRLTWKGEIGLATSENGTEWTY